MRKFAGLLFIPLLSFAVNVPSDFINAYKQGREDEFNKIQREVKDLGKTIQGMLKFREYLIAGKIPPPIVVIDRVMKSTPDGVKVIKKVRIYFPSEVKYAELEKIAVRLSEDYLPDSGYYVYFPIANTPDYAVGFLKVKLKQLGYKPFTFKGWLVAGVYQREADAISNAKIINSQLHRENVLDPSENFDYAYVEIGKD